MTIITSRNKRLKDLCTSFEDAAIEAIVDEQADSMDGVDANTGPVNQEIEELNAEILSIENHIDAALDVVAEDSELAEYAEQRSADEETPSMESFVLMLNDYNNRSRRASSVLGDATLSLEAAEEFAEGDESGKKEKLKALAKAAGGRVKTFLQSIINAIKDWMKKIGEFGANLFDKSVKIVKQAKDLRAAIAEDKTTTGEVPISRSGKSLLVDGKFDIKSVSTIADVNAHSRDYIEKLVGLIEHNKWDSKEEAFVLHKVMRQQAEPKFKWHKVGDIEVLVGTLPGDVVVARKFVTIGDIETESYGFTKAENAGDAQAVESIKLLNRDARYTLVDIAEQIAKNVSDAKNQYKGVNDSLKEIEGFLNDTYKKLGDGESEEGKYDPANDIKAVKVLMENMKTFAMSFQKYSLERAEAILNLVREHDKVAAKDEAVEEKKEEKKED